ncbi:Similar to Tret1: Facilitated trehalose transporter Tret1 (Bombyx mori) [Cotesia congregata]|uniref:Similar to Tret1: Facilitated trehalose transporter Tret1 (Bombyx mori) n=1 Tax=Cotesia congregata TaxID=51543 RepID=A0A8J2HI25_COTCN|nr:Similar to Tret1: Facilitated trehalose transporter Tret1 (Bombyx mori) [Cotesia congregata]
MTQIIVELPSIPKKILWPQWLTGITISLAVLTSGLSSGWTSPYLAKFTSPDMNTSINLSETEASWVASLLNLGRFGGSIVGATSQGIIGRKKTLLISTVPMAIGWTCTIIANSVTWLYVARCFCGIAGGMMWTTLSLFIGEVSDSSIRGSLVFLNSNAAFVGAFLGNIIGAHLPFEQFGYVSLSLNALFFIIFCFIPDSPYHYVTKGDLKSAEASLKWFKREANVLKEIQELKNFIGNTETNLLTQLREFKKPQNRKNVIIMGSLNVFLYFCGHNTMNYYAEIIVTKSKVNFSPSTIVIALSLCTIIACSSAAMVVDRFGRRFLLIASSLGTALSLALLGLHFHLLSLHIESTPFTWLPIASLFLYNFSISHGLIPVPNALISELFPPNIKTMASLFFSGSSALLSFATTKTFQPLINIMSEKYVFWIFALSAFSAAPFTYAYITETKGQTLVEIQINADQNQKKN